jgi:D-alanyl-lipoteichoic acid acyltransferase DltB (MBOAT superfamily)
MTLVNIGIFILVAVGYGFLPARWRGWALLIGSVVALYWLQPAIAVQPVDFALPTATLLLTGMGWLLTRKDPAIDRVNWITVGVLVGLIFALALVGGLVGITPSHPPALLDVALPIFGLGAIVVTAAGTVSERDRAIPVMILLILAIFVILKSEGLTQIAAIFLRGQTGYQLDAAGAHDLGWLGFSYVAFRLIHTLRDRQSGKLPALTLREYVTYVIFFPSFTAGPIDRAERFVKDYRALETGVPIDAARWTRGLSRIAIGCFKKFAIADQLALFALNSTSAGLARSPGDMWLLVYAYAFRLFFDFSGYSDIAIGIGILFGIELPENFNRPYLKDSITTFWQSWHMTLSNWIRFYVFTPLSRWLMGLERKPSPTLMVLITQTTTMVAIGLWHGITLNFVIWGLWHAIGLWVHKLYTDRTRTFYQSLNDRPALKRAASWLSILLTFHFVALGWVWFALPDPATSWHVLLKLFGLG